ncbi:MAG: methylated-DNA--[protein]-cysteine S-methyltransferase [Gallionella sp.]|nr:methylated-DNA--[protein]-cysteine S-methyltransferase [Gallionella sp.]MDD4947301.1 methylated-DNA--[protein]-cysteine S-methyltransferase [Gallionella sp.]MDD5611967.1 methylated-DNA--[protein]-cysteine S-methyltransferase [Gallionella sp.]
MNYQAILSVPFGTIGIRCDDDAVLAVDLLRFRLESKPAANALAAEAVRQLQRYFDDPDSEFALPLKVFATPHQQKVWQAMLEIPRGQTRSYGELAAQLHSSAQAVGGACGANPFPILIPCHRVVAKAGIGGFMKQAGDHTLDIKRWLLRHEGAL